MSGEEYKTTTIYKASLISTTTKKGINVKTAVLISNVLHFPLLLPLHLGWVRRPHQNPVSLAQPSWPEPCLGNQMPEFLGSMFEVIHSTVWARSLSIHSLAVNLRFQEQDAVDASVPSVSPILACVVITMLSPWILGQTVCLSCILAGAFCSSVEFRVH